MRKQSTLLWHDKSTSWFEEAALPEANAGWAKVRSICSFVSMGTERVVTHEQLTPEIATAMAVPYQKGSLDSSFTYGYSVIGEVIEGETNLLGKRVHIMHPHQDIFNAKIDDLTEMPEAISPEIASIASNMETAINAIWDAGVELGDKVLIIGYGVIGALITEILQKSIGIEVKVLEQKEDRASVAIERGISIWEKTGEKFDVVFNTSSNENMLQKALEWTAFEGKVVELSWYGTKTVRLQLGADFHYGRKKIIASQVSNIPERKQPKWNYKKRKRLVFQLLSELDLTHMISNQILFTDSLDFYDRLRKGEENCLSTLIIY